MCRTGDIQEKVKYVNKSTILYSCGKGLVLFQCVLSTVAVHIRHCQGVYLVPLQSVYYYNSCLVLLRCVFGTFAVCVCVCACVVLLVCISVRLQSCYVTISLLMVL